MVKFSITLNSFSNIEPIEQVINLLIESGLYYIEIPGDPFNTSLKKNLEIINTYNLSVIGVTGLWTRSKRLSPILLTTDQDILSFSIDYIKECIKMCNYFGGTFFNICLLSDKDLQLDYNHEIIPREDKRKLLKRILPILSLVCKWVMILSFKGLSPKCSIKLVRRNASVIGVLLYRQYRSSMMMRRAWKARMLSFPSYLQA